MKYLLRLIQICWLVTVSLLVFALMRYYLDI